MRFLFPFIFFCLFTSGFVHAEGDILDNYESGAVDIGDELEEWEFREDIIDLPDYPSSGLMSVDIDLANTKFEFFIDPKSLKVGVDDIVRYIIVIRSPTGYENVFYEGLYCFQREYKTYAYGGGSNKKFVELADPVWRYVAPSRGTGMDYRYEFMSNYMCDENRIVLPRDEILHRIRYPEDHQNETNSLL